jgi:hypothetical protein
MLTWRAPWWMYAVAAVYALACLFNTRQEFWGPASEGWVLSGGFKASSVLPGGPMDKAGLRAGRCPRSSKWTASEWGGRLVPCASAF